MNSLLIGFELNWIHRAGDVKDFVKKIKLEDARIDQRRKTLLKTAERIALAKAKAAQAKAAASSPAPTSSPAKEPPAENTNPAAASIETPSSSTLSPTSALVSEAKSPLLHPSLPAKPGVSSPAPETATVKPAASPATPATPASVPLPAIASPAPVVAPPPVTLPPDEQINRLEEVRLIYIRTLYLESNKSLIATYRTSYAGHGLAYEQPETNIFSTSAKLALVI